MAKEASGIMGNLMKILIVLVIVVGAIALAVRYTGSGDDSSPPEATSETEMPQVQEKYGFAPIGEE
jgi:hypothetical protein